MGRRDKGSVPGNFVLAVRASILQYGLDVNKTLLIPWIVATQ